MSVRPMAAPRAGMAAKSATPQQIAQAYMALLGHFQNTLGIETPHLEGGASSRLSLSLRSGIAEEQDFALQRLLQATDFDPELLPLHAHFLLIDALLELIETEVDRREEMLRLHPWANSIRAEWQGGQMQRACEAGLILRNLATHEKNALHLNQQNGKRLRRVIIKTLKLGLEVDAGGFRPPGPSDGDNCDELKLYMLEVLQCLAPVIRLKPATVGDEVVETFATQLWPVLAALAYSPDRAIVISAMSLLADLARADAHEALFSSAEAISPVYSPLARALELLPLQDAEINAAALAYLYAVTNSVQVSIELTKALHFVSILRHLLLSITRGGQLDLTEEVVAASADGQQSLSSVGQPEAASLRLAPDMHQQLVSLPEPQRGGQWIRYAFEADPAGEVSQVDFWGAYQAEFRSASATNPMLQPGELIKHSIEAIPTAVPRVAGEGEDKRFSITGISPRNRNSAEYVFRCKWIGCSSAIDPSRATAAALYQHVKEAHSGSAVSSSGRCQYFGCRYVIPSLQAANGAEHSALMASAMALHLSTHIPSLSGNDETSSEQDEKWHITASSVHTQRDENGMARGGGFLAAFALRNIARAIKTGMAHDHSDRMAGAQDLISAIAGDAGSAEADTAPVRMSAPAAREASTALLGLETDLLGLFTQCPEVTEALYEVMQVCTMAHAAVAKSANAMQVV